MQTNSEQKPHSLEGGKQLTALAIIGAFWGLGVALLDSHFAAGAGLCLLSISATIWLYYNDLREKRLSNLKTWPWLGIAFIVIEVAFPVYIAWTKGAVAGINEIMPKAPIEQGQLQPQTPPMIIINSSNNNYPNTRLKDSTITGFPIGINNAGCVNTELDNSKIQNGIIGINNICPNIQNPMGNAPEIKQENNALSNNKTVARKRK